MGRVRVGFLLILVTVLSVLVSSERTEAHALLVRADPAPGARLRAAPARVSAWFSEPLDPGISSLRVVSGSGERIDRSQAELDPRDAAKVSVALRDDLRPGFYGVTWETLSRVDGHIWFGSFEFTVLEPDGSLPNGLHPAVGTAEAESPESSARIAERSLTKIAGLLGAIALVGSLAFVMFVARPAATAVPDESAGIARAALRGQLVVVAVPALVLLVAAGGLELVVQARQLGGMDALGTVLHTTWGQRWVQRQILLLLLIASVGFSLRASGHRPFAAAIARWTALVVALGYLALVSAVSHAAATPAGSFWAATSDFVHLTATAVWVGGLVQLALLFFWSRRDVAETDRPRLLAMALQRFSLLAATAVVLLLSTGIFNALVEVSTPRALLETAYGRALTAKLLLAVPLLGVAGINAVLLRPQFVRAATAADDITRLRRRLTRLVAVEVALALAVIVLAGVLVQYPPARSATGSESAAAATAPSLEQSEATTTATTELDQGGRFAYPLVVGNWGVVGGGALVVAGVLAWVWSVQSPGLGQRTRRRLQMTGATLPAAGLLVFSVTLGSGPASLRQRASRQPTGVAQGGAPSAAADTAAPAQSSSFNPAIALRYQTAAGRFVLLEVASFQVGDNTFHVTLLDKDTRPVSAGGVALRFSRLEEEAAPTEVQADVAGDGHTYTAGHRLSETGWWAINVIIDGSAGATFYARLDNPSKAPLAYAPPDYGSDPAAEALFRQAMERYEGLASLRWREELTSGLLAPTGIGAWVVSNGEARAPDRLHLQVLSPGYSEYDLYRVASVTCTKPRNAPWQCTRGGTEKALDFDFQKPATAFRLGRREMVDGEMSRVVLFYNPSQPAWYVWWVGESTGYLRRQAMVAPGHFMLTRYFDHNQPVSVALPADAR